MTTRLVAIGRTSRIGGTRARTGGICCGAMMMQLARFDVRRDAALRRLLTGLCCKTQRSWPRHSRKAQHGRQEGYFLLSALKK